MNQAQVDKYLKKFGYQKPVTKDCPRDDLEIIVVIPCYNEPELEQSLRSLNSARQPQGSVEVLVVLNQPDNSDKLVREQNLQSVAIVQRLQKQVWYDLKFMDVVFPKKIAGVGLARKVGMDEALVRFSRIGKNGAIVCFDADSIVDKNYFTAIRSAFSTRINGCSIYFEHDLFSGSELQNKGIVKYELFLRYYNLALNYTDLPYAHYTVGSSMAVSCEAYIKVGGMNKRQAGEDFYFLQKVIQLQNFHELVATRVIPSSRVSDRVPFGTGRAVGEFIASSTVKNYPFEGFRIIKKISDKLRVFDLHNWDAQWLELLPDNFFDSVKRVRNNHSDDKKYQQAVFQLFNAFQVLKFMHKYMSKHPATEDLSVSVKKLLYELGDKEINNDYSDIQLLNRLREIDRTRIFRTKYIY